MMSDFPILTCTGGTKSRAAQSSQRVMREHETWMLPTLACISNLEFRTGASAKRRLLVFFFFVLPCFHADFENVPAEMNGTTKGVQFL